MKKNKVRLTEADFEKMSSDYWRAAPNQQRQKVGEQNLKRVTEDFEMEFGSKKLKKRKPQPKKKGFKSSLKSLGRTLGAYL